MKLKNLLLAVLFCFGLISATSYAEDLLIGEGGETLKIDLQGRRSKYKNIYGDEIYNDKTVYGNISIGAKGVDLGSEWQYVFISSKTKEEIKDSSKTVTVTDTYANSENLATLTFYSSTNTLTINSGYGLSIRNEYNLVTSSASDVTVIYEQQESSKDHTKNFVTRSSVAATTDNAYIYDYNGYQNRNMSSNSPAIAPALFEGTIIFSSGTVDTVLTFKESSNSKVSNKYVLPKAKESTEGNVGGIYTTTNYEVEVPDWSSSTADDRAYMTNDFILNANRSVFNVEHAGKIDLIDGETTPGVFFVNNNISGDGSLVKAGNGVLFLSGNDANGLTGANNNGYGWIIEEGWVCTGEQNALGLSKIKILENGILALSDAVGGEDGTTYYNDITSYGGHINLAEESKITLKGNIDTKDGKDIIFVFSGADKEKEYSDITLILDAVKSNNDSNMVILYEKTGNSLVTDVDGLGKNVNVQKNGSIDASFGVLLKENDDKSYNGSLSGDMYLVKTGTGTVTLLGESDYSGTTVIHEGGLILGNSKALGEGFLHFDSDETDSSKFASIGVSSNSATEVHLNNDIKINKGAIFQSTKEQTLYIDGDFVATYGQICPADFIKEGKGNIVITNRIYEDDTFEKFKYQYDENGTIKNTTISTFTINSGLLTLDKGVVAKESYIILNSSASLVLNEKSGVESQIDLNGGNLTIFNEENISSATINVVKTSGDIDKLPQLHITSHTILTKDTSKEAKATLQKEISITEGLEFIVDKDVVAEADYNVFKLPTSTTPMMIKKSSAGYFTLDFNDPTTTAKDIAMSSVSITGGRLTFVNTNDSATDRLNVNVSSITLDNGMLIVSSGVYFTTNQSKLGEVEMAIGNGSGIGLYNSDSIDSNIKFNFTGTDKDNLGTLRIEQEDATISNSITVSGVGLIIENENNYTFTGAIKSQSTDAIFAKAGSGKMVVDSGEIFEIAEFRALDGTVDLWSGIKVSTFSISGGAVVTSTKDIDASSYTSIDGVGSTLALGNGREKATLNTGDMDVLNGSTVTLNKSSVINAYDIEIASAVYVNLDENSKIAAAGNINIEDAVKLSMVSGSSVTAQGNISITDGVEFVLDDNITLSADGKVVISSGCEFDAGKNTALKSGKSMTISDNEYFILGESSTINSGSFVVSNLKKFNVENGFRLNALSDNASVSISSVTEVLIGNESKMNVSRDLTISSVTTVDVGYKSLLDVGGNVYISSVNFAFGEDSELRAQNATILDSTFTFKNATIMADLNFVNSYVEGCNSNTGARIRTIVLGNGSVLHIGEKENLLKRANSPSAEDSIIANNVSFASGSALDIDIALVEGVEKSDMLDVSNELTVGADVDLNVNILSTSEKLDENQIYLFDFLKYGTLNTQNSEYNMFNIVLTSSAAWFDPLEYTTTISSINNVFKLQIGSVVPFDPSTMKTKNQKAVVAMLEKLRTDSTQKKNFEQMLSTLEGQYKNYTLGQKNVFEGMCLDLSGVTFANTFMASALTSKSDILYSRLAEYSERSNPYKIWAQVYTNSISVSEEEKGTTPEFTNSIYGLIAGFDQQVDDNAIVGFSAFYGTGEFKQIDDKADVQDAGADIYGSYKLNNFMFKGLVGYTSQNYDMKRDLKYLDKGKIESNYAVNVLSVDAAAEYNYELSQYFILKPFIGVQCNVAASEDINEDGIKKEKLKIKSNTYTKADARVGVGIQSNGETRFNWYASVMAKQLLTDDRFKMTAVLSMANDDYYDFEIESTKIATTAFAGGLGAKYDFSDAVSMHADFSMDTSSTSSMYNAGIGATYKW